MKALIAVALVASLLPELAGPASAQVAASASPASRTFRVDDTGTFVLDPYLQMQWQPFGRGGATNIVSANTKVSVQLNLSPWLGQAGRIYMTLPRTSGPTVRASWTTGGVLLPGTVVSGDRSLVYQGPITAVSMRDVMAIKLEADGSRLGDAEALAFGFEIEIDQ